MIGLNGLGGSAQLSNVSVTGSGGNGGSEFITAPLTVALSNPSNISLDTNDVSFAVYYDNVRIGRAAIDVRLSLFGHESILLTGTSRHRT